MKELFNILPGCSDFFNEKRFVYQKKNPEGIGESLPAVTEKKGDLGGASEKATKSKIDRAVDAAREATIRLKEQRAKEKIADMLKKGLEQGDLDKAWKKATEHIETEYIAYRDKVSKAYDKMLEEKAAKSGEAKDVTTDNSEPDEMGTKGKGGTGILPPPEDVVALFNKKLIPDEKTKKPVAEKMNKYIFAVMYFN